MRRVQLRAPSFDSAEFRPLARLAIDRCRVAGVEVLINGDIDLARELGVGVHLRDAQVRALAQRPLPDGLPLAASCHDAEGLARAEQLGCDFAVLGPIGATASHPGAAGIGWDAFAALREHVSLPLYAIGGMTPVDIAIARSHGGQGIAAIRALWAQASI
jgi:8-oxo-dGTP diphosphatase